MIEERRRSTDREFVALKELLEHRFDSLNIQFDSIASRIDALVVEVKTTNGRLRKAENDISTLQDRLYMSGGAIIMAAVAYAVSLFRR
jgi:hypothetical protein